VSGPERDDWDDRRLDAAFQARFDQPAPAHLRERILHEIAASTAPLPLLRSFRAVTRTAIAAIAILVAVIATMTIGGVGPTVPPGASASAQATELPTTPPLIGTVGAPFPTSIRPSGSDATYAVLSVPDAAAIRDRGVDDREIAVAGWFVPPQPVPCPLAPDEFQPLEDCALNTSWLLGQPCLENPGGPFATPFGRSLKPVTDWRPLGDPHVAAAVVFVGHFDDARAVDCPAGPRRAQCQDRFVVDTVAWDDAATLTGFPREIDGLPVIPMSQAIAARETDLSGELAVAGWYQEPGPASCPATPQVAMPFLEGDCTTAGRWFLESPESIITVTQTTNSTTFGGSGPLGPAVNPVFPTVVPPGSHPLPSQGGSTPTQAILIGHFNDPRASLGSRDAPQTCLGRFVVDAVPWVEGAERVLPERTDWRAQGRPAPFDPVTRVRDVAPAVGTVLNLAAMTGADLVRIEPRFDLAALGESTENSIWIVTSILSGSLMPEIVTFAVDEHGVVFSDFGNGFVLIGISGMSPGPT
jgi:hypothetical protein